MGDLRGSSRVAPLFACYVNLGLPSLAEDRLSFSLLFLLPVVPRRRDPLSRTRDGRRTSSRCRTNRLGTLMAKHRGSRIENGPILPRRRCEMGLPVSLSNQIVPTFPTMYHNGESRGRIESYGLVRPGRSARASFPEDTNSFIRGSTLGEIIPALMHRIPSELCS